MLPLFLQYFNRTNSIIRTDHITQTAGSTLTLKTMRTVLSRMESFTVEDCMVKSQTSLRTDWYTNLTALAFFLRNLDDGFRKFLASSCIVLLFHWCLSGQLLHLFMFLWVRSIQSYLCLSPFWIMTIYLILNIINKKRIARYVQNDTDLLKNNLMVTKFWFIFGRITLECFPSWIWTDLLMTTFNRRKHGHILTGVVR